MDGARVNGRRLYGGTPAAGPATVFTAPLAGIEILLILAVNNTGGAQPIRVQIDPADGTAFDILNRSVPANDEIERRGPIHLNASDAIVVTNTSGAIQLTISGVQA